MRNQISFLIADENKNNEFEKILNLGEIPFKKITLKQFLNTDLTQFTNILFLPGQPRATVLLSFASILGTHRVLYNLPEKEREIYEEKILGKKEKLKLEKITSSNRKEKYQKCLDNLIKWYFSSGVMPEKDGSKGIFEGFRSIDHKLIPIYRTDCNGETALAMFLYGRIKKDKKYQTIAENIFKFLFEKGWQDFNKKNATYGLWKFYDDYENYTKVAYGGDNFWVAVSLFMLYKWSKNKNYLKRALLTSEKFYKNWEYYGSNGDVDWGPYCIESG